MNCEHVEELLSAYLDNMLAPTERKDITEHLNVCPSCSNLLNEYRYFDTVIAHLPRYSPSPALYHDVFFLNRLFDQTHSSSTCSHNFPDLPQTENQAFQDLPSEDRCHFCMVALPIHHKTQDIRSQQTQFSLKVAALSPATYAGDRTRSFYIFTIMLLLILALSISLISWEFWAQQSSDHNHTNKQSALFLGQKSVPPLLF
ncbi:MAG TPA: zf-HC2 domain-containing protein [Ktedonobacteraceae bacterium]|nr:zf-HC2 domain-containing protein [Ktedonobacteraceae bacterium]